MMRDTIDKNGRRWAQQLTRYIVKNFRLVGDVDGVVSDAFFQVIKRIDGIEERFKESCGRGRKDSKEEFLYGCLRLSAKQACLSYMNSVRVKRGVNLDESGEFDYNITGWRPTAVVQPEQENVVFYKQMMEHCHALPPEEAAIMALTLDRATAEEIVNELGVSHAELIRRRMRAMNSLMNREFS